MSKSAACIIEKFPLARANSTRAHNNTHIPFIPSVAEGFGSDTHIFYECLLALGLQVSAG
jgi:hypothetical protein